MPTAGPANVVRVALTAFRWPLDPALAVGRDETTIARALYATPLRTDPATGTVVAGLCTSWRAADGFRRWIFHCASAPSIAATIRRLQLLDAAPARWLFAGARVAASSATTLSIRLRFAWRRFPYALTAIGTAPRFVPGPFRLVSGSARRVVVRGAAGLTVQFVRMPAVAAVRKFRGGELDEAPVPLGDIVAARADPQLGSVVRARTLLGLDVANLSGYSQSYRQVYWQTADRGDYEQLVPELNGSLAYGVLGGEQADPAAFRRAVHAIGTLRHLPVWFSVPPDPALRFGARLLYAQWRDLGLGLRLVRGPGAKPNAGLRRLLAQYPQAEALPAQLVLNDELGSRRLLLPALAAGEQHADLEALDRQMQTRAGAIPIAWVVDARLVSPRLTGWREDVLGNVDYAAVRSRASSRRP